MKNDSTDIKTMLQARIDDAVEKVAHGQVACIPFLTPLEHKLACRDLSARGILPSAFFFGGYPNAERVCLFLLPDYLLDCVEGGNLSSAPLDDICALLGEDLTDSVTAVLIRGSGFRTLSHRDYLGSVLSLGLRRDALGDLCVQNDREAVLFCSSTVAKFLSESLERVANDTVKVKPYSPDENFTDGRAFSPIRDTVASERLDCVVAALSNLSRADAQDLITSGMVELDFEQEARTDLSLTPPCELALRGFGRFRLLSFDGETKKGRLRLIAEKYV